MFLAHIREDGEEQSLLDHLEGVRELATGFAASFGGERDAAQAAMLHDIGKYSDAFQRRIRDPEHNPRVDHSTAGAVEAEGGKLCPVAFAVAGHHTGIPDRGSRIDTEDKPTLWGRFRKSEKGGLENYDAWRQEQTPISGQPPAFFRNASFFTVAFYTRMLYSCLVDADFLDTERFMKGELRRGRYEDIPTLLERLERYTAKWGNPTTPLNHARASMRQSCIEAGKWERGLYTLTVPTGGGKTMSSLEFALRHAKERGMNRVIYIIPYTSIIDQTVHEFEKALGAENVLAHHSAAEYDGEGDSPREYRKMYSTENWDAPVVVTTAVQFFESLYANRSSRCRKLHNIAGAVLIFDEAQTIPVPYLQPCVAAIAQLVQHYGATAVLCTATQPALEPLFEEYGVKSREICPDSGAYADIFRRVTIQNLGTVSWEALCERLRGTPQALCIVNRRKTAQALFAALEGEGCYCLSTLLYPRHRKELLAQIRSRLEQGLPCRVISTSLIEAGVDVDFPMVLREKCGLDSLLQAAGRCNREGKRPAGNSFVYMFSTEEAAPPMLYQNITSMESVLRRYEDFTQSEAIEYYFRFYRNLKGNEQLDEKNILNSFKRGVFPFKQVNDLFQLISTPVKTVYVPIGEGRELVEKLRAGEWSRKLFRKLGQYGVNVYPEHFKALSSAGALEVLENGDGILRDTNYYKSDIGLSLDVPVGQGIFIEDENRTVTGP